MCIICDDGKDGLCYLHEKYKKGLTGPHFDTLFDYVWFQETLLKTWNQHFKKHKLKISLGAQLEQRIQTYPEQIEIERTKIKKLLESKEVTESRIWNYSYLVIAFSVYWNKRCSLQYLDLVSFGQCTLASLDRKINWGDEPKQISSFIYKSLSMAYIDFVRDNTGVMVAPGVKFKVAHDFVSFDEEKIYISDFHDPEKFVLLKEKTGFAIQILKKFISLLNDRELYVLYRHILADKTESLRKIAKEFNTSTASIFRDKIRILNKFKEEAC